MHLLVNDDIRLALLSEEHAEPMFQLIDKHRHYLSTWLLFIHRTRSVNDVAHYIQEEQALSRTGKAYAFAIFYKNSMVGRITLQKVNQESGSAELAYWLAEDAQGKGIITLACQALIDYSFSTLNLSCLQIHVDTLNERSKAIPEKLNFTYKETRYKAKQMPTYNADVAVYELLR